jgi:hypothetical protein
MGKRIFLHLGAHKTATTFLQANIISNSALLKKMNWRFLKLHRERRDVADEIRRVWMEGTTSISSRQIVDTFFAEVRDETRNVFLSCEILLGGMDLRATGRLYPEALRLSQHLKDYLIGEDISVGYCIRNYADYAESSYNFLVTLGAAYEFDNYIETITSDSMSWLPVLESLTSIFGKDKLHIWEYETFSLDPASALLKILQAAGIDAAEFKVDLDKKNLSYQVDCVPLAVSWNKLLNSRFTSESKRAKRLRRAMRELLLCLPPHVDAASLLPNDLRLTLDRKYRKDLAIIHERWDTSLLDFSSPSPEVHV